MPSLTRTIGDTEFPAVGYGAMSLGGAYGEVPTDEESSRLLDRIYELGYRHWDTANIYGISEAVIGKWFKRTGKRKDIFLATKFGFFTSPDGKFTVRGDPGFVRSSLQQSIQALGVDQVDLYYLHRVPADTPIEVTVGTMAELVNEGKVRYLGLSECSSTALRRAYTVHPIAAVQVEYSPFTLDIEDEKIALLKTCRELGVKIVAYSPLGRGLLTGQIKSYDDIPADDFRKNIKFYKDSFTKILQVSETLKTIGQKHKATAGQVALAWLLAQGDDIIPIPGTKRLKNVEENIKAMDVHLTSEEVQEIRAGVNAAGLTGVAEARYPPGLLEQLFVDSPPLNK